jgi:histidinol dehydrogenase
MRISRSPGASSAQPSLTAPVAEIIEAVRTGGDAAVLTLTERFDHAELGPEQLRVDANELESSIGVLEQEVLA